MNSSSRLLASLAAFAIALAGSTEGAAAKPKKKPKPDFELTLFHNNDGESKLATGDSVPNYGGAPRFATVLERLRAEVAGSTKKVKRGSALISSGDNFLAGLAVLKGFDSGPPWPDAVVMNQLGYDAITIGNHEFDFGQVRLAEYIEGIDDDVPFISANLGFDNTEPELKAFADSGQIVPSVVLTRGSQKVGVIGLTTPSINSISSPGDVDIETDLAAVVNDEVAELKSQGVNKIIVSAHLQGIAADNTLIQKTTGVDLWIAGGGDDLLANPDDVLIPGDAAIAGYPSLIPDDDGNQVRVVSTSGEYRYLGRLTVRFDPKGRVKSVNDAKSGPVRVSGNPADPDVAEEDPALAAVNADVAEFVADLASQVVGSAELAYKRTESGLTGTNDPIRRRESGYGNLVADSFLWKSQQLAAGIDDIDEPQVAIANGGGIRADISAGSIDRADTFAALPFFNQMAVVEDIPCESLRQLLERAYSGLPTIQGRFANIAGMRVEVDPLQTAQVVTGTPPFTITTPGARVRNLWRDNGTPQNTADDIQLISAGAAVANCPTTDLATTDFTAKDGDAYPFATLGLTFQPVGALYNQAFEDYIAAPTASGGLNGTVTDEQYPTLPTGIRRITITGDTT